MRKLGGIVVAVVCLAACGGGDRLRTTDGLAVTGPDALDFGRVGLGATVTRSVSIRNGGRAPLAIGEITLDGIGRDFDVQMVGGPILHEGETARIDARFSPKEEAVLQRIMEVKTNDPQRQVITVPLTGIGVRPRILTSPTSLDFGKVELGVADELPLVLENGFDIEVEVELSFTGDPQFSIAPSGSVAVPANSRTEIAVTFQPQHLGKADGMVRMLPCPICDPVLVPTTGIGIDQALLVEPPEVDFGYVPVERSATRTVQITNVSSHPVDIHSITPERGRPAFSFTGFSGTLQPDQSITVEITFSPTQIDLDEDWMLIDSTSERSPIIRVHLFGRGGGPQIQVTPPALTFGAVPLGARGQLDVIVTNAGTDPGAPPLRILNVYVENPADAPFGSDRDLAAKPVVLQAGEQDTIRIGYEPVQATGAGGDDRATLVIVSNDQMVPEVRIPMSGSAFAAPPCNGLEFFPSALDFGSFPVGWGGVLSFRIYNPGPELCILRNLRIAAGSDPAFTTWPVESFVIPPDQGYGWMVAFDPHAVNAGAGYYTGELEFFVANAGGQRYALPLAAGSLDGCLSADPNFIDFGTDQTGCGVRERSVRFTNMCPFDVVVGPVRLGTQSTEGEFELVNPPGTPFRLASGQGFNVDVRWNTQVRGINSAPIQVWDDTRDLPLTVPVMGELLQDGVVVDRFVQHRAGVTDVLILVDNSSSMVEEQPRLKSAVHVLVDEAARRGNDFRMAVTSTGVTDAPNGQFVCPGGVMGNEAGRFFPVDEARPRIVTPGTANGAGVLAENTQVGFCHELEQGLEAMRLGLSEPLISGVNAGFLRPEARLAVVFVGDEDDHSGYPVAAYTQFLAATKGLGGAVVSAIVDTGEGCPEGAGVGRRYIDVARSTGGVVASLCAADWSGIMKQIADKSFADPGPFVLGAVPGPAGVQVYVNGAPADPSAWRYDAASNSVSFVKGREPAPGSTIEVRYEAKCD